MILNDSVMIYQWRGFAAVHGLFIVSNELSTVKKKKTTMKILNVYDTFPKFNHILKSALRIATM